jgi:hypothetical protein
MSSEGTILTHNLRDGKRLKWIVKNKDNGTLDEWVATIKPGKRIRYNHLHDLTYFSGRGGENNPRCRCGELVPEELHRMAMLQRIGQARENGQF